MGIFGSASSKQVDEFAVGLARTLRDRCPPQQSGAKPGLPAVAPQKLASTMDEICREARAFRNLHKLGIYKKARLGNTFRWELTALGYDKKFVETMTQRVVVHIAKKA